MKRPLRNVLSLASGDLGSRFIGFLVSVYLARVLEPAGFGLISVGLSVLGYLQLAGNPGIQILETRNTAASPEIDGSRISSILSLRVLLAAGLWILTVACVSLFFSDNVMRRVIVVFALALFPLAVTLDWFFQGKEDFLLIGVSRLLQFVTYGLVVVVLVHGPEDVTFAAIAFVSGTVIAASVLWSVYRRRWGKLRISASPTLWKDMLAKGMPVGGAMFLAQSVTNLPPLVIGYFATPSDVGLFSSAMKLIFLLLIIDRMFNALFLPAVTRYFAQRSEEVSMVVGTTLKTLLALVVPLTVVGILVGRPVMTLFFGDGYDQGAPIVKILMGYFALTVLNSVFVCILIGSGHEKEYTRLLVWGSIVVCVAVTCGAAWLGPQGAAGGVVLGELVTLGLMLNEAVKFVSISATRIVLRPLLAGGCMVGTAVLSMAMGLVAVITLAVLVFIVMQILLRGITAKEIQFLKERFV